MLVTGGGIEQNITIDGNHTIVNVTDLLPGNEYIFRIIAVASDGQTSPMSAALIASICSRVSGIYICGFGSTSSYCRLWMHVARDR